MYHSTKTYTHAEGLSCCFRQWRAVKSHCRFLHGYALQVSIDFKAVGGLDERNWAMDFGSLGPFKEWLKHTFDHRMLIAQDDPMKEDLIELGLKGLAQPLVVEHVGCEAFAKMIHDNLKKWMSDNGHLGRLAIRRVSVAEHPGNSAYYYESPLGITGGNRE